MQNLTATAIFILFLHSVTAVAQTGSGDAVINGVVQDEEGRGIPNATVALYDPSETTLITGTASDVAGEFSIDAEPGSYILQISFVSYSPYRAELELTAGSEQELGTITLAPVATQLDEVVVEGERSFMQMNFDSRVFSVGEDITSMGGSALDVLDNVPSLSTDFEGNVSLRGNEGVQILINGRPSSLVRDGSDALSSIPAELIEEVEVITNPSARYAAQGSGGIINIVLKDNVQLGFNGSVSVNTGYPEDHGISTNLNYHVDKVNWFLSTNSDYESRPGGGDIFQRFSSPDTSYIYRQNRVSDDYELDGRVRFGAEIFLPADQILTATTQFSLEGGEDQSDVSYIDYFPDSCPSMTCDFSQSEDLDVMRRTDREDFEEARERDQDFRLEYENRFGNDHVLTADFDFEFGRERENSNLTEIPDEMQTDPVNQRTDERERYSDIRFQADYERPIGDSGRFETGFRSNIDWMDSDYLVEEQQNGSWVPLPAYDDNFQYSEGVHALYAIYSGQANPFTYQFGLRAEQTSITTELDVSDERYERNYLDLFPSVFLTYQLNEENSLQVSYSRRLRRPWSRMLLPFSGYSDSRNISRGNPDLEPEFGNSFESGYLRYWETGSVLASVYYRHRTGVIEHITQQETDPSGNLITVRFPVNLSTEEAWGLELTGDQDIVENLQLSGSANLFRSQTEGIVNGEDLSSDSDAFQGRLRMRWRFLEGWNFQSSLRYYGPRSTTQGRRSASSFVDMGLSRELFGRSLTISLSVRDLLNSRQQDMIIEDGFFYSERANRFSTRSVRLYVRYRFSQNL